MKKYEKGDVITRYIDNHQVDFKQEDDNGREWRVYIDGDKFCDYDDSSINDVWKNVVNYISSGDYDVD